MASDGNASVDAFVRDRTATTTTRVSLHDNDTQSPTGGFDPWIDDSGNKVVYRSRDRRPPGGGPRSAVRVTLVPGAGGRAKILAQGRGVHLDLGPLPAAQPVTVQVKSSDGICWEADYGAPATRNDSGRFQDRSD